MPDLDLYSLHQLDRSRSSADLAAQLTAELDATNPRDNLARTRIETARAILADPQRRVRYDAQLADPAAPPVDEATLAHLAGRPVPIQRSGLAAAFASTQSRVLAGVVAALALVLVVVIVVVATSGGGDGDTSTTVAQNSEVPGESVAESNTASSCTKLDADRAWKFWYDWNGGGSGQKKYADGTVLVLDRAVELPAALSGLRNATGFHQVPAGQQYLDALGLDDRTAGAFYHLEGLNELPDGSIMVRAGSPQAAGLKTGKLTQDEVYGAPDPATEAWAVVSVDGVITSQGSSETGSDTSERTAQGPQPATRRTKPNSAKAVFQQSAGAFDVAARDGVVATPGKGVKVLTAIPSLTDYGRTFVLFPGDATLYLGTLYDADGTELDQAATQCA